MKKIILLLFLFVGVSLAQTIKLTETQYDNDMEYYFYGAVCDSGTTSSGLLEISKFNSQLATYPLTYDLYISEISNSNPILGVYVQGKTALGTWANVDTIFVADTVTTTYSGTGLLNLNVETKGVKPEYRIVGVATSAKGKTYLLKVSIYAYKQD